MSTAVAASPSHERQKPLQCRRAPGVSQQLRRSFQLAFLALNIWIGIQFCSFVRYYETGVRTLWVPRPPGIGGWLPIASLMNLKLFLATGEVPRVHPAGLFVLVSFLAISWLLCKSFCGWLCPVGTISEYLWRLGKQTFGGARRRS
jgi:polyferredoxin